MRIVDIILKKRFGGELTREEIEFFIDSYVRGETPDYQASALLMAICFAGMTPRETAELTMAMTNSGDVVDLSAIAGIKVDKHSTGGVGDTTTLIVAPLVAACGVPVAKMSGRGLGHTGGTLDKLEALDGVNVSRSIEEFIEIVNRTGIAIIGQTSNLVPADKKLYALRDVTGTVASIPLIASSIMSKKIAAGSDAIVLDVKTGSGAFMSAPEDAFELARQMVDIGAIVGRETVAIVTDMNQPLGNAVGNLLEVQEAILALSGRVDPSDPLMEVSMLLGRNMLVLSGCAKDDADAELKLKQALDSRAALEKLRALLVALGNDGSCIDNPDSMVNAKQIIEIKAPKSGYIVDMNAEKIGIASQLLGAGREKLGDVIDPDVGLVMCVRLGAAVEEGRTLCTMYVNDSANLELSKKMIYDAIVIGDCAAECPPMVYAVVNRDGVKKTQMEKE